MFSSPSYAEGYACSHELSRFERAGEIEAKIYQREGNNFINGKEWIFKIIDESESRITFSDGMLLVVIDKNTKEFGEFFYHMEEFRKHPPGPLTYGECIKID